MHSDSHESFQRRIDQSLAGELPGPQEPLLREHLESCTACQEYLNESNRAIASLGGFSFTVDPALQEKVSAALALRSHQLHSQPDWRKLLPAGLLALLLIVAGTYLDLRLSTWLAPIVALRPVQIQQLFLSFWIVPSLCLLLLFPLLPLLSQGKLHREDNA